MTKLYRTTLKVVVLSEDRPITDSHDLEDIHNLITDGDCSGEITVESTEELTPIDMARALEAQGSDPSFFQLEVPDHLHSNDEVIESVSDGHGRVTGDCKPCTHGNCGGVLVAVRWQDGSITHPCSARFHRLPDGKWRLA